METSQEDDQIKDYDLAWKDKKGFDLQERATLKINQREAQRYKKRKNQRHKLKPLTPDKLNAGLYRLRQKIRDSFDDEDEDDENYIFIPIPQMQDDEDNKLLSGLNDEEKRMFKQKNTIEQINMQQTAGKMEALQTAQNLALETMNRGLNKKMLNNKLQEAIFDPQNMHDNVIEKNVGKKLGLRGKIEDGKIIQAARGIKKAQEMGGKTATKDLDMKDVVKAGEGKMSERDLAKLILKKSGQDIEKYQPKKKKKTEKAKMKYLKPVKPTRRHSEAEY